MREKFFSIICAFSLLINSLFPIFSVGAVYAEDSTGSATVASPSPAASEAPSPSASIEPTDIPTPLPSPDPTPTPIISPSPEISPEPMVSTTPSTEPENTPTPTPDENIGQANAPPEESPSPAPTPEPSPSADVEQAPTGHIFATILENTDADSLQLDLSTQNDVSSATLTTDKGDYAPTDTVVISGSDFLPDTTYTLVISSSDPPAVNFQEDVTTNEQGSFIYSYQLDGTYRPNYLVELKDESGNIVATTAFTDAPVSGCTNDSAGANDYPGQKDLTKMCVDYSGLPTSVATSWNWDDTSWSGNNTGDACNLFDTDGDGLANYALCVQVSGDPAVDQAQFLYSCNDTSANRCFGSSLLTPSASTTCTASVQTGTDPFDGGSNTVASCTTQLSDVGGATASLIDVCSYPSEEPNSDPSDCIIIQNRTGKLEVVKDLIPDSDSGLFNLQINGVTEAANVGDGGTTGEKVLDEGAHTVGETAGTSTNLGNYTTAIVCKDLNGTGSIVAQSSNAGPLSVNLSDQQDIVCIITNSLQDGTIIVHKDVQGPNGEAVLDNTSFTVNLDGTNAESITESTTVTYNNVAAGTHTITENTPPAGYTLFSMTPDNDAGTSGAQITVNPGLTTDVYVVNRQQHTRLTVTKIVTNDNGGTKVVSDFPLFIDQTQVTSGQANNVNPGTYTVSETGDSGYTETISGDCNSSGQVTLALGESKTCTITNNDQAGTLIIKKVVVNNNGGNKGVTDFSFSVNGGGAVTFEDDGQNDLTVNAGTYSVTEPAVSGYTTTYDNCSNVNISNGGSATCTITNNDVAPTITLIKEVIKDNGGNAGPNDFGISVGGQVVTSGDPQVVDAHTPLAINETGLSGYTFVSITGDAKCPQDLGGTVALNEGENITCTITNNDIGPTLTLVKTVVNDNGGTKLVSDFVLRIDGNQVTSGTANAVDAGLHTASEVNLPGYSPSSWGGDCAADGTITLALGDNKTCTITNDDDVPTLHLLKTITNDNGGVASVADWTLTATGTGGSPTNLSGTTPVKSGSSFKADTYALAEVSGPSGYSAGAWACIGGTMVDATHISMALGESAVCTINNDDNAPSLTLNKVVIKDDGGTAVGSDWILTAAGPTGFSGAGPSVSNGASFDAGTYDLSESGESSGYTASDWVCTGGTQVDGDTVTVALGQNVDCTITNNDQAATLIVVKHVINDNGGTKNADDFNLSVTAPDASPSAFAGDENGTTVSLDAGSYSVDEASVSGYLKTLGNDCSGTIALGETKTCTITNDDIAPSLTLVKQVTNNNGGTKEPSDWSLYASMDSVGIGGTGPTVSSDSTFSAGAYILSETGPSGYSPSSWVCVGGTQEGDSITLGLGQSATCTITNDDIASTLKLVKVVTNNNGGNKNPVDWTLTASGEEGFSDAGNSTTFHTVKAGVGYVLSESTVSGYDAGDWSCDGGILNGSNVTLGLNQNVTCSITNNDRAGTLIVKKVVTNDNGGTKEAANFSFQVNGGSETAFEDDGQNDLTVNAGTYNITEAAAPGYDTTYDNCSSVVIPNGGTQTCTITNNDQPAHLKVIKHVENNDGGTAEASDFTMTINGVVVQDGNSSFNGEDVPGTDKIVEPGTYNVTEEGPSGYSPSFSADCSGTIALGQTKTCTVTNDDIAPKLTLVKEVNNDNGGTATESDFNVYINGQITSWGQRNLNAGQYTISEDTLIGYTPSAWGGDCDVDGTITLNPGDNKICTITNDDDEPSLTLIKEVLNDSGGDAQPFDWELSASGPTGFSGSGPVVNNDLGFVAGTYTLSEEGSDGYSASDWVCTGGTQSDDQITIGLGEEVSCTITNDDKPGSISGTKWDDLDGNGERGEEPGLEEWHIQLFENNDGIKGAQVGSDAVTDSNGNYSFEEVNAGSFLVCEVLQNGWMQTYPQDLSCYEVGVELDEQLTDLDFGNFKLGKISGKKFNDKNGDHIRTNTTTDPNLPDWTIILDKVNDINPPVCTGGTVIGELCVTTTNSFGNYAFNGLEPGTYLVSEDLQTGWIQTRPGLFNETLYGGQGAQAGGTYLLILQSGDDIDDRDFGNQGQGTITVHKNVDTNGDGEVDEENVTDWTWDINQEGDFATGDDSQEVSAGTYTISEDQKPDYHVTSVECDNEESYDLSESIEVTVEAGQDLVCTFTNTRDTGTITILKNIDNNEDGDTNDEGDVRGAENWTWDILDGDQDIATGQTKTLPTGNYTITEDQQDSYNLLGWSCSNEQTGTENSIAIEVTKDSETTCTFTNQLLPPVLTLTKANNRTGIDVSAGADVLYTLTVTLTGSPLSNVSLIDLPPAGFKYRSGSWTAVSSERGDLKPEITTEPTYASPGTWSLGDMVTGETVTLTYIADIDSSTDPGLYKDLAWSSGEGQTSSTVLANENSGFFVGTEVNVVAGSGDSAGVNVVREERGEVLGISTELPQTGINTIWSVLAILLLASGAGLIFAGISLRRKYE